MRVVAPALVQTIPDSTTAMAAEAIDLRII
jgi:hypothetical protein